MDELKNFEVNPDYTMAKKINGHLYLSEEQLEILNKYGINFQKCRTINDLIFNIELSFPANVPDDLENLLDILTERDYYENFDK